jgi:hypothetical protein
MSLKHLQQISGKQNSVRNLYIQTVTKKQGLFIMVMGNITCLLVLEYKSISNGRRYVHLVYCPGRVPPKSEPSQVIVFSQEANRIEVRIQMLTSAKIQSWNQEELLKAQQRSIKVEQDAQEREARVKVSSSTYM